MGPKEDTKVDWDKVLGLRESLSKIERKAMLQVLVAEFEGYGIYHSWGMPMRIRVNHIDASESHSGTEWEIDAETSALPDGLQYIFANGFEIVTMERPPGRFLPPEVYKYTMIAD